MDLSGQNPIQSQEASEPALPMMPYGVIGRQIYISEKCIYEILPKLLKYF
jgi:hypothetical protein